HLAWPRPGRLAAVRTCVVHRTRQRPRSTGAGRGDTARGEQELRAAIHLDPLRVSVYVNLSDLYRVVERDLDGDRTLRHGLVAPPGSGALHYALGRGGARLKWTDDAVGQLERATTLDPGNARFACTYGVALRSVGRVAAARRIRHDVGLSAEQYFEIDIE